MLALPLGTPNLCSYLTPYGYLQHVNTNPDKPLWYYKKENNKIVEWGLIPTEKDLELDRLIEKEIGKCFYESLFANEYNNRKYDEFCW